MDGTGLIMFLLIGGIAGWLGSTTTVALFRSSGNISKGKNPLKPPKMFA